MPDFLLEIGCEEIPARMIEAASRELRDRVSGLLTRERLSGGEVTSFDTPRRLTVMASGVAISQDDVVEQMNGPSVNVAYKDGMPTPAAQAFAKKAGIDVSQLERVSTPKGEYISAKVTKKGRSDVGDSRQRSAKRDCNDLLAEKYVLAKADRAIRAPRSMAGGDA